ncbi:hypothetical protein A3A95_01790 [Candidatus Nomurabacteria bacterium RIFCSPLOWO2_01_FULL_39_18]|uniref:Uncharacterized protein n=1 Tax=Candidatus Nomurabacteria bacterium RIFCSPHIGHO2_01_FULL_40_24b TaxID=1801739 RepID=A0A1F6V9K7_9BACT|nr:MAG: hypothetical protein A2647_00930 [Candidatus Nomurabacteria bacterium RIFCSPHIGHO2_01_FULL_40_24b]OGI90598.1 MAG: hypothetical protein A3A95_01790 [Candidatus Nomurabacteria bacterium RIFCSPLOWO2_01_FULL_39_18]
MVGRKLTLVRSGQIVEVYHSHPFILDFDKVKYRSFKHGKRILYLILFITIRFYVRSSNFLRNKYNEMKIKLKTLNKKGGANGNLGEKVEVSKFLRIVSEYKHKIKEIKHKVHEEEKNS